MKKYIPNDKIYGYMEDVETGEIINMARRQFVLLEDYLSEQRKELKAASGNSQSAPSCLCDQCSINSGDKCVRV